MNIIPHSQATNRTRPDGTEINYYLFDEYEVHYGELPSGVTQPWHHHQQISETLYIVAGEVEFHYLENGQKKVVTVDKGDVIEVGDTPHTFANPFSETCIMIAFRFIPEGVHKQDKIKQDKVLHPELEE